MNTVFYFIIYQISRLPLSVLYLFSDFLYFLLYTVIGYRRNVIKTNLRNSFPEKSATEIDQIYKDFYKHFTDYLVETLKAFSVTQEELDKRHTFSSMEVFQQIKDEGKNAMMMNGHVFNWEWYINMGKYMPIENTAAVYHKVKNPFWNEKINQIRERFGTITIDMKEVLRFMMKAPNDGSYVFLFVADQSPKKSAIHFWTRFLNQDTPAFNGFDKIAIRKDMGVVYCKTVKVKRGYYHTSFERMYPEDGIQFKENEIVYQFFDKLENHIKEYPANWLWSHKRWKYKKEDTQ